MTTVTWQDRPRKVRLSDLARGSFFVHNLTVFVKLHDTSAGNAVCSRVTDNILESIAHSTLVGEVEIAEVIVRGYKQ
jgi:hypothetical protein